MSEPGIPVFNGDQLTGLQRQPGDTVSVLPDATLEAKVRYICRWSNMTQLVPRRNVARHPDFPNLICKAVDVTRLTPGVVCEMIVTYRGFTGHDTTGDPGQPPSLPPGSPPGSDYLANTVEEVVTSMSDAPIETHPDFLAFAGTPTTPLNGAIFDKDDKSFKGWEATSQFAGVQSYLIPSTIYRITTPSRSRPNTVGPVGSTANPGIGGGFDGNWLFTGRTWRRDGGVFEVSEEYMLSGPGGWDSTIYP